MLTWPPENRLAYRPRLTLLTMSSGLSLPPSNEVLVMRGSGIERNDSRRPLPVGVGPKCVARVEHGDRDARGLAAVGGSVALGAGEVVHAIAAAAAAGAGLALAVLLGDGAHAEPHQGLHVGRHAAVAGEQQDLLDALGER